MIKLKNIINEDWSQKYKDSINCDNPKGFSQKAHCAGKEKNELANFTHAIVLSKEEFVKEETASDIIKDLDKVKNDLLKKVEVLIAKKKKLYANVDIESPMSAEEKKLDKDIADVFSQINQLVIQKRNLKKESVNESDLKGYLAADVVDDIIKSIGTRFVSGEIKQSNKNKIYLKLKDVKFGSGVVKILKSRFGIDAKEEMFGGKDKFGSTPSVSFWADKVVSESVNEAKLIKVKFNDNDQTLYFSDGEKSKVDYDGEFKYKGKWFDTSDMNSSKDLEKMLAKAFPGTKFIQTESAKSDKLASLINNSISKVDSSLSYKDFAMAVGKILKDEYGSHLYSMFVQELNKELKKENESIKLGSLMASKVFEENVPTDKALWDKAIAAAKEKYDVYPSAYANAFASKWYKEKGGDWKTEEQIKETFTQSIRNLFSELVPKEVYNAVTPQQIEKRKEFVRDLVKTLNNFYKQHGVDWKFADTDLKFKMYSKN